MSLRKRRRISNEQQQPSSIINNREDDEEDDSEYIIPFEEDYAGFSQQELSTCIKVLNQLDKRRHYLSHPLFSELTNSGSTLFAPVRYCIYIT
jgi:hypothetical protein